MNDGVLSQALADLGESHTLEPVGQALQGGNAPLEIVEICRLGTDHVGALFAAEYSLPQLIMAGEIVKHALALTSRCLPTQDTSASSLRILIGTVQSDTHESRRVQLSLC